MVQNKISIGPSFQQICTGIPLSESSPIRCKSYLSYLMRLLLLQVLILSLVVVEELFKHSFHKLYAILKSIEHH